MEFLSSPSFRVFAITGLALFLYECIWWAIACKKKRSDIADIAWGGGFILVAWLSFALSGFSLYGFVVNLLVTLWGARLAVHIWLRNWQKKEDFRYESLKKNPFLKVFLLQGAILYIVALPIIWIHVHSRESFWTIIWVGIPYWLYGFVIEAISDYQLFAFQKDPQNKGKLLTKGLWGYVRHPNYLGELIQWWVLWSFAIGLPFGWAFVVSPLLLTFLIVKVSGIAPLEAKMANHPDFVSYAKKTPSLIEPSLINWIFYTAYWLTALSFGPKGSYFIPLAAAIGSGLGQIILFYFWDKKSYQVFLPLAISALLLGYAQEWALIHFKLITYLPNFSFAPLWLIAFYPLLALTLNSSLFLLNKNLFITFIVGGGGALFSYVAAQNRDLVHILHPGSYPIVFIFWGIYFTLMILINRFLLKRKNL